MQLLCAPSAGLGRIVGDDKAPWLSLDADPDVASKVRFAVDADAWEVIEIDDGEDILVRLRLERDQRDALRLALILADEKTSQKSFGLALDAFKGLIAQPAVLDFVRTRANASAPIQVALHKAGLAVAKPQAFAAGSAVHTASLPSLSADVAKK